MSILNKYIKLIMVCLCFTILVSGLLCGCNKPEATENKSIPKAEGIIVDTVAEEPASSDEKELEVIARNIAEEKPATANNVQLPEKKNEESVQVKEQYCTLSIRCDTLLSRKENLAPEKLICIPENGVILAAKEVSYEDGNSVFDVLKAVTKKEQIHLEFVMTPAYNSAYIEGINNIYEFDGGELSGWTYRVNGKVPGVGCSEYKVKNGDVIEFLYTCDMGRDLT